MTRNEAIKMLKSKMDGNTDPSYEWVETIRMAIEALEQKPSDLLHIQNDIIFQAMYEQFCESANQFFENVISAEEFHNDYSNLAENIGLYVLSKFELLRREDREVLN